MDTLDTMTVAQLEELAQRTQNALEQAKEKARQYAYGTGVWPQRFPGELPLRVCRETGAIDVNYAGAWERTYLSSKVLQCLRDEFEAGDGVHSLRNLAAAAQALADKGGFLPKRAQ